jgi:hypothetical protein
MSGISPRLAGPLMKMFEHIGGMDPPVSKKLYGALIECMDNVKAHAYPPGVMPRPDLIGEWWMAGFADPAKDQLAFVFLDQGAGIPTTIKDKRSIRFQSYFSFHECQKSAVDLVRLIMESAADHFSNEFAPNERSASSAALKLRLKMLSTESAHLAETIGMKTDAYLMEYMNLFDAITRFPFETFGTPHFDVDRARVAEIGAAGEEFVAKVYRICK